MDVKSEGEGGKEDDENNSLSSLHTSMMLGTMSIPIIQVEKSFL